MINQFVKKLIKYYIDLIVSWYREIKTKANITSEIKNYHKQMDELEQTTQPIVIENGKFGEKDWFIEIKHPGFNNGTRRK
tara:strand:- start:2862 stop:3101 length:240 start_codon:yes stop_codon:yes gene_type:complete